jgi:hypothetical protein
MQNCRDWHDPGRAEHTPKTTIADGLDDIWFQSDQAKEGDGGGERVRSPAMLGHTSRFCFRSIRKRDKLILRSALPNEVIATLSFCLRGLVEGD